MDKKIKINVDPSKEDKLANKLLINTITVISTILIIVVFVIYKYFILTGQEKDDLNSYLNYVKTINEKQNPKYYYRQSNLDKKSKLLTKVLIMKNRYYMTYKSENREEEFYTNYKKFIKFNAESLDSYQGINIYNEKKMYKNMMENINSMEKIFEKKIN